MPAIALAGGAEEILVLFAFSLLIVAIYPSLYASIRWVFDQAIQVVGGFPVVGGQLARALFSLRDATGMLLKGWEFAMVGAARNATNQFVHLVRACVQPVTDHLAAWNHAQDFDINVLNLWKDGTALPTYWAGVVGSVVAAAADIAFFKLWGRAMEVQAAAHAAQLATLQAGLDQAQADIAFFKLWGRAMEVQAAAQGAVIARDLEPYAGLLRGLQGWEHQAERALDGLGRAESALGARVNDLERYRPLLALLTVLGVLSLSEVQELARTARCIDVCNRLGFLDDIPDRVEALENAGH